MTSAALLRYRLLFLLRSRNYRGRFIKRLSGRYLSTVERVIPVSVLYFQWELVSCRFAPDFNRKLAAKWQGWWSERTLESTVSVCVCRHVDAAYLESGLFFE